MLDYPDAVRRAWPILLEAIRMRRTIAYSELAGRAGPPLHHRHIHRQLLLPLSARCRRVGLPDLSALVVRKDSGLPGGGWFEPGAVGEPVALWAMALEDCFRYPWPHQPDARLLDPSRLDEVVPNGDIDQP